MVSVGGWVFLPVLPLYLQRQHLPGAWIGLIIAAEPAARIAGTYPSGWLSDRIGRRRLLLLATAVYASSSLGLLLFINPVWLLLMRVAAGVGSALFWPSAEAGIADLVAPGRRGRAYAWQTAATTGGLTFGPLLGGLIGQANLTSVFAVSMAVFAASFMVLLVGMPPRLDSGRQPDPGPADLIRRLPLSHVLVASLALAGGFGVLSGVYETIWPLFMSGVGASEAVIGLSFAVYGVSVVAAQPLAGRLSDRFDRRRLALFALAAMALLAPVYPILTSVPPILALSVLEGLVISVARPAYSSLLMDHTEPGRRARAISAVSTALVAGQAAGSVMGGWSFGISPTLAFWLGGLAMLTLVGLGGLVYRKVANGAPRPALAG